MVELTREYLDQKLAELVTKKDLQEHTEALARIVNTAFQQQVDYMDKRFEVIERKLEILERGQEEIKLRLDNVAYRFELVELQKRVEAIEEKVGIKREK